ncbi:MAG: tetratricopeptide repeat protein, partial [Desulfuromonadales bacterium]
HACFCLVWAGVFYLPTANIWPINWLAADRYLYAPSVGFFILAAYLLDRANMSKMARYFAVIAIVLICAMLVVKQNAVWKSSATLWSHAMKVNADSVNTLVNVASAVYYDQPDKQLELLRKALAINPRNSLTYYFLGKNFEARGDDAAALKNYRKFFIYYNAGFESGYKYWVDELRSHVDSRYHLIL